MRAPPPLHNQRQKHAFASTLSSGSASGVGVLGGSRRGFGCFLLLMVIMGSAAGSWSPGHHKSNVTRNSLKNQCWHWQRSTSSEARDIAVTKMCVRVCVHVCVCVCVCVYLCPTARLPEQQRC